MSHLPSAMARIGNGPERRRHPRCRVLEKQLVTVEMGERQRGILVDVSVGGAAIQPYEPLEPGQSSRVQFAVPGEHEAVEADGVVTWVGPSGRAGIRFVNVPEPARRCLHRWIEGMTPSGGPRDSAQRSTAAYLPPSYSPWIKIGEMNIDTELLEDDLSSLDLVSALRMVTERARVLTRATGTVLALADGAEFVCRARAGVAPDLGARFSPDSGLSGQAVRTSAVALCSDATQDGRVDQAACERLGIRSIAIVPVLTGDAVVGVIEAFAADANAFSERDVLNLERLAGLIGAMLGHGVAAGEEPKAANVSPSQPEPETKTPADTKATAPSAQEITEIYNRFKLEVEESDKRNRRKILLSCLLAATLLSGGFGAWHWRTSVRNSVSKTKPSPVSPGLSQGARQSATPSVEPTTPTTASPVNEAVQADESTPANQPKASTHKPDATKAAITARPERWTWAAPNDKNTRSQKSQPK